MHLLQRLGFGLALLVASAPAAPDTRIFMSPSGNDASATPHSHRTPMKTLQAIHDYLEEEDIVGNIEVCISPGVYHDQTVDWRYFPDDSRITLQPDYLCTKILIVPNRNGSFSVIPYAPEKGNYPARPIFDGSGVPPVSGEDNCNTEGAFFKSRKARNLTLRGLHIRRYHSAIVLRGIPSLYNNLDSTERDYLGENIIEDSLFEKIGARWVTGFPSSSAGISIAGSSGNIIRNNEFHHIEAPDGPTTGCDTQVGDADFHMHAIYVNAASEDTQIIGNDFAYTSGSTIRVRDGANHTFIANNTIAWGGSSHDDNHTYAMVQNWMEKDNLEWTSCDTEMTGNFRGPGWKESIHEYMAVFHSDPAGHEWSFSEVLAYPPDRLDCSAIGPVFVPEDVDDLRDANPPLTGCALMNWYASMELVPDSMACDDDPPPFEPCPLEQGLQQCP